MIAFLVVGFACGHIGRILYREAFHGPVRQGIIGGIRVSGPYPVGNYAIPCFRGIGRGRYENRSRADRTSANIFFIGAVSFF